MKQTGFIITLLYQLLCVSTATAQVDTFALLTVEVLEQMETKPFSFSKDEIRNKQYSTAAELLQQESNIFIRSHGIGGIASASARGGAANHFPIFWNGMPIQSPMLGQADLSMVSSLAIGRVTLSQNANSAMWGSAAIGPQLHLANHFLADSNHHQLMLESGSFNHYRAQTDHYYTLGKTSFYSALAGTMADNNFKYLLRNGQEIEQTNATTKGLDVAQGIQFYFHDQSELNIHMAGTFMNREIPPSTVQNSSESTQKDHNIRTVVHWKKLRNNKTVSARMGYQFEENIFNNPLILLSANNRFHRIYMNMDYGRYLPDASKLQVRLEHEEQIGISQNYQSTQNQHVSGLGLYYAKEVKDWMFNVNIRQGLIDGQWLPFTASLGTQIQLKPNTVFKVTASKNYRHPTLNERFWIPGGNPNIRPENSWNSQIEINHSFSEELSLTAQAFYTHSRNWILWSPTDEQIWRPQNIQEVESKGLEMLMHYAPIQINGFAFKLGYIYTRAYSLYTLEVPRVEKDQQLIYIPKHQGIFNISYASDRVFLSIQTKYVGKVQTPSFLSLDPYVISNLNLKYALLNSRYSFYIRLPNIWNVSYRVLENRPMPGRHFRAGVKVEL